MGCENTKEKIEEEMLKMKLERFEIQKERYQQLKILKEIDGYESKAPIIPDYIDPNFTNNNNSKPQNDPIMNKDNNIKIKRRPNRSKSTIIKSNNKIFNFDEDDEKNSNILKGKRRGTRKRKTMRY